MCLQFVVCLYNILNRQYLCRSGYRGRFEIFPAPPAQVSNPVTVVSFAWMMLSVAIDIDDNKVDLLCIPVILLRASYLCKRVHI